MYSTIASVENITNNIPDTILIERIKFNITHNYSLKRTKINYLLIKVAILTFNLPVRMNNIKF